MDGKVFLDETLGVYSFECPHCNFYIQVERNSINCGIFRHASFFRRNPTPEHPNQIILTEQVNPHASKEECERLVSSGMVYGCGKPFKIERNNEGLKVTICDYI